jgi:hypothetical protein
MLEIRIVCAHEAIPLAEMLMRLLEAEEYRVRMSYGRQSLQDLEETSASQSLVLLIWSPNARSQTYMIEWARTIEPAHLIEIAHHVSDCPPIKRLAAVIDFTNWRGQRGARCWKSLDERLAAIIRARTQKVPLRTLATIGAAGLAAVSAAVVMGVHTPQPETMVALTEDAALDDPSSGIGGPLSAIEPESMDDGSIILRHYPEMALIEAQPAQTLADLPELGTIELREPTLLERLNSYNPLRRDDDNR